MAGSSFDGAEVVWRVLPLAPPRVLRHCARCGQTRPFASTDKFRLNAQQRHIDVWLLYACVECDHTWKRELLQRSSPEDIGADLYARLLRHDRETAWQVAFAPGERFEPAGGDEVRVERCPAAAAPPFQLRLEVPFPLVVRLDRILAAELGLSRSALQAAVRRQTLLVPGGEHTLRRSPRDGTRIVVRLGLPLPRGRGTASS